MRTQTLAVLFAASEVWLREREAAKVTFRSGAERGRPAVGPSGGVTLELRTTSHTFSVTVECPAPGRYRMATRDSTAEVEIVAGPGPRRTMTTAGGTFTADVIDDGVDVVVTMADGSLVVSRDAGVVIRAPFPAFVAAMLVTEGEQVVAGQSVAVLEAMKMESQLIAEVGGTVARVDVLPNTQVDAGAAVIHVRRHDQPSSTEVDGDLDHLPEWPVAAHPCDAVFEPLSNYLLGYDLTGDRLRAVLGSASHFDSDPQLVKCEDDFIDQFVDAVRLSSAQAEGETGVGPVSAREYLRNWLQWLDPDRAGLPTRFRRLLARALARYGVVDLRNDPTVAEAAFLLFQGVQRVAAVAPMILSILKRRLQAPDVIDEASRQRLDRLITATQGRLDEIAETARDLRFQSVDLPALQATRATRRRKVAALLAQLRHQPPGQQLSSLVAEIVACPDTIDDELLKCHRLDPPAAVQQLLLEIRMRRVYRPQNLADVVFGSAGGVPFVHTEYELGDRRIHLIVAACPIAELSDLDEALAAHLSAVDSNRLIVLDVAVWADSWVVEGISSALQNWQPAASFHRVDVTLGAGDQLRHFTFRGPNLAEDLLHRDLHPMLAKRLELWRMANFVVDRLPAPDGIFLFHGRAKADPQDHRLFAVAEVWDLSELEAGIYPDLERAGLQALAAMRSALATFPAGDRPKANRLTLFFRPRLEIPRHRWADIANLLLPLAPGSGLDMVQVRADVPAESGGSRPTVLQIEGLHGGGITIRQEDPRPDPIRPLTPYRRKVLTAARFAVPYPWEILRLYVPTEDSVGAFHPGDFVEHDLDDDGRLTPVSREPGLNAANVIVGVVTTFSPRVPEGMTRVAIFSDPTRGLGALAAPECVRVDAAIGLAERLGVPVEWFAVSSGALISTASGTENMDAIAGTLRRIIEFTQGGGEINVVVTGINVGGQPYWNAEATMLMHTRGVLIQTRGSAMVLTGKQALDYSGGVSADDNLGIGGYDRIMGPNGQAQYHAETVEDACRILSQHYEYTYVVPGERFPRKMPTEDPVDRDVCQSKHSVVPGVDFSSVGDIFSATSNRDRKRPFDMRSVMRAVADFDREPLERWGRWRGAENAVVWDAVVGGTPVGMLGIESYPVPRRGYIPADGPMSWTAGTLFPQASRKVARAVNAIGGARPLVVLANLSGFDGSPESMRHWQLEYGAEIGRAVTNFSGPIVFVVISRYHGGAFVVFSKALNPQLQIAAVAGSYASVIGGAPAAATVFAREVRTRVRQDPRLAGTSAASHSDSASASASASEEELRSEHLGRAAEEFDAIHTIERALEVGSVDQIIEPADIRPWVIEALRRGMAEAR